MDRSLSMARGLGAGLLLTSAVAGAQPPQLANPGVTLSASETTAYIEHRVPPRYPSIAEAATIEGTVEIRALLSPGGRIEEYYIVRSVPLLDSAALDALAQWRFRPVAVNGRAVSASVSVEIPFYLPRQDPSRALALEDRIRECHRLLDVPDSAAAEPVCLALTDLAGRQRDPGKRADAYDLAGRTLVARGRPMEARKAFERALSIRRPPLGLTHAGTYHALARVEESIGDSRSARKSYERAEAALRESEKGLRDGVSSSPRARVLEEGLRTAYLTELSVVLKDFVGFLQRTGQTAEAAKVQARLETLQERLASR